MAIKLERVWLGFKGMMRRAAAGQPLPGEEGFPTIARLMREAVG